MKKVFDHPVRGRDTSKRLLSLHQGSHSVAEFSVEFRTLATESGWNDEALQGFFLSGLSDTVKDELAARDESTSLDELIPLAIRLDNRLRECRRERDSRPSLFSSRPTPPPLTRASPGPVPASRAVP